ncbi:MAG: AgmX/PglI C-terminal domain-containing protein, partial [Myxococcota bacterium]
GPGGWGTCDGDPASCTGTAEGHDGTGLVGRSHVGDGPGGNFIKKGQGAIGTVGGNPIILGALDRSLIDEVIKSHMAQIRYCYQRELQRDADLGGKLVVKFTIAKDGTVARAAAASSTLGSAAVDACVVGRFQRMQFPTPKGGGIVVVSYPFLFSR